MRHLHATDVRFLESFFDQGVAKATPINTIAVLSRADEIGVGRLDALSSARRIARRYRADDKIRGLCQTVVAVAGLLAQTGRTMRQHEFTALTALAGLPRADLDAMLLSVDRFARTELAHRSDTAGLGHPGRADGAVRAVRGAAGHHPDPPGHDRPEPDRHRAGPAQRPRRAALGAGHPVHRAARPAQGPLRAAGHRPGADPGAAARLRPRWPPRWSASWPARTSSPSCGCSPRCARGRSAAHRGARRGRAAARRRGRLGRRPARTGPGDRARTSCVRRRWTR